MEFVELMIVAKEAKQRMVQCNMRLVVSIAKRYKHVGVNIADLVQEGSIGLTRAAEKFDPGKGFKFSTYASWYVPFYPIPTTIFTFIYVYCTFTHFLYIPQNTQPFVLESFVVSYAPLLLL